MVLPQALEFQASHRMVPVPYFVKEQQQPSGALKLCGKPYTFVRDIIYLTTIVVKQIFVHFDLDTCNVLYEGKLVT